MTVMSQQTLRHNVTHSIQMVSSLKSLVHDENHILLDQLKFYLDEIKLAIDRDRSINAYQLVEHHYHQGVDQSIKALLKSVMPMKNIVMKNALHQVTLDEWNHFLRIVPLLEKFVRVISCKEILFIELQKNRIKLSSRVETRNWSKDVKNEMSQVTREFLALQSILTLDLESLFAPSEYDLTFNIDYNFGTSGVYSLDFISHSGVEICFPDIIKRFFFEEELISKLQRHHVLFLYPDLSVELRSKSLAEIKSELGNRDFEVIHFPFIFTPISLIIPIKGTFLSAAKAGKKNIFGQGMGHESNHHRWHAQVGHNSHQTSFLVDFFALFR